MSRTSGGGWLAVDLVRRTVRDLNESYVAVPTGSRRRWWGGMLVGAAAVQGLVVALVLVGQRAQTAGILDWEPDALRMVESLPLSFSFGMWLEGIGNGFVLWLVMLFAAGVASLRRAPLAALSILVGYTGVYLHIATGWLLWDRPRPTLIAQGIGSPGAAFSAYPSGHLVQSVFAYGLLIHFWYRASGSAGERAMAVAVWMLVAAAVTLGRLRIGAHWPSDMVAGALIGTAWLAAVIAALRYAER